MKKVWNLDTLKIEDMNMWITVWGGPEITGEDLYKIGVCMFKLLQDKKKTKEEKSNIWYN